MANWIKRAQTVFGETATRAIAVADDRTLTPVPHQVDPAPRWTATEPDDDIYAVRVRAALRQINAPDYPAEMVPWLNTARPDLYTELTAHLPDEIHRLWSERSSLELSESVLTRLVSLHRQCCELYRTRS